MSRSSSSSSSSSLFSVVVESLLSEGIPVRFRAGGRSMLPTVRDGECLTVAPVAADDVVLDDVVLCRTWRGELAHRVLEIHEAANGVRHFLTRGDASLELDRPVDARQIRGRVVGVEGDERVLGLAELRGWSRRTTVAAWRLRARLAAAARDAVVMIGRALSDAA